ncbi:YoaK family protein [Thiomicrorhabdus sp. Milos-T2]|uniref:YoaK family protein n=1 Tax=Thiomicrorhabdus sp. Milos-T2 TaxID=90814 RepID=UPI000494657E|nr:YoaK family protein [Thiomicrorhabdus sp. Milos-T2]
MPYPIKETDFHKFPVFLLAALMASLAGYVNSAMLIEFAMPVSQMTGIASRLSDGIIHIQFDLLINASMVLFGFLFGAFLSGLMIGQRQYRQDNAYGYALLCISTLLTASTILSYIGSTFSVLLTAIACGLQNALIASYRGLQIRTTHMTGIVTDIGVFIADFVKTRSPWTWQAYLLVVLFISFIVGGFIGIVTYEYFPKRAMTLPAVVMLILGMVYLKVGVHQPKNP